MQDPNSPFSLATQETSPFIYVINSWVEPEKFQRNIMQDPNSDITEIFDFIEDLPNKPRRLLDGIVGWARGDNDPDWNKGKKSGGSKYKDFR